MSNNVAIQLKSEIDKHGNTYYYGMIEAPVTINCEDGVTFLVFISDKGCEELQIAPMTKKRA